MAEKIMKKIKQKKDDGTWAEYKIGADAEDVTITLNEEGADVSKKLSKVIEDLYQKSNNLYNPLFYIPKKITDNWFVIQERLNNGEAEQYYHVGDYIEIENFYSSGETERFYIIGINGHNGQSRNNLKDHIDFCGSSLRKFKDWISEEVSDTITFTQNLFEMENNNGTADAPTFFKASPLFNILNDASIVSWFQKQFKMTGAAGQPIMPTFVKKNLALDDRYSAEEVLESSTQSTYCESLLWLLTENEIFGNTYYGTIPWSIGQSYQYPFFQSVLNRQLIIEQLQNPVMSTVTPMDGSSTYIVTCGGVDARGLNTPNSPYSISVTNTTIDTPICFRLEAE